MPDVQSIGLGGGSRVRSLQDGKVTVGPDSVGHHVSLRKLNDNLYIRVVTSFL